jgi:hypothetical protein
MKFNVIPFVIALFLSALLAYGLYSISSDTNKLLLSIGSFVFFIMTLGFMIGIGFDSGRTATNAKIVAGVLFLTFLIVNSVFSITGFSIPTYLITNGILLSVYLLIEYSLHKSNQ